MNAPDGLEALLRDVTRQPAQVEVGIVTVLPIPNPTGPLAAELVQLLLQPGNRPCEARVAVLGAGIGKGVFTRLVVGEQVLVLLPGGDVNRAVVLGSIPTLAAGLTASALLAQGTLIQDPLGVHLRSADGIPADGVVLGTFLVALQAYVTALSTFMGAVSLAAVEPTLAPAAVAFQTASAAFVAALGTSAAIVDPTTGGVGGAPYASTLVRATA